MVVGIDPSSKRDLARLMKDLNKTAPAVGKETKKRFKDAAQGTLAKVKNLQPRRTGALSRRTKISVTKGVTAIRSSVPYARISEFGGRHPLWGVTKHWVAHPATPAIWPAVQEDRAEFMRQADRAVYAAMKEAGFH